MDAPKQKRYHDFMEKYMSLQRIMRRHQKNKQRCNAWLLVAIHSINQGEAVRISQISSKLEITNAATTQMIDTLESQGFVERQYDDSDHRITLVKLTEDGKAALKFAFMQTTVYLDGLFDYLGEEDTNNLTRLIDKMMEYTLKTMEPSLEKKKENL
jgi:DNA-binding MarR family transcriptional regulator